MKILIVTLSFIGLSCAVFAQDIFTLHDGRNSAVHLYYDTDTIDSHVSFSIYPSADIKKMSDVDYLNLVREGYPIVGAYLSIVVEADNDCFLVFMGENMDSIYGYVKRSSIAVSIALIRQKRKTGVFLYKDNSTESKIIFCQTNNHYAQLLGKQGNWLHLMVIDKRGRPRDGWIAIDPSAQQ